VKRTSYAYPVELRVLMFYNYIIMRIVFSEHATERVKERDISVLQIFATVKSPQNKSESYRGRIIYSRKFGSKTLEVITKLENKVTIIISAYMVK
jgi:hypothetical protein